MKSLRIAAPAALLVLWASPALAANLTATLDGIGSTPEPTGTGKADFTYDDATKTLCGKIAYTGLTGPVSAANLQEANGTTLPLIKSLPVSASPMTFTVTLSDAEATKFTSTTVEVFVNLLTKAPYTSLTNGEVHGVLAEGGDGAPCPVASDAGTDASTPSSSGSTTNDAGNSSGTGAPSSSGLAPTTTTDAPKDEGCSTSGEGSSGGGWLVVALAGLAVASRSRSRRR